MVLAFEAELDRWKRKCGGQQTQWFAQVIGSTSRRAGCSTGMFGGSVLNLVANWSLYRDVLRLPGVATVVEQTSANTAEYTRPGPSLEDAVLFDAIPYPRRLFHLKRPGYRPPSSCSRVRQCEKMPPLAAQCQ